MCTVNLLEVIASTLFTCSILRCNTTAVCRDAVLFVQIEIGDIMLTSGTCRRDGLDNPVMTY